MQTPIDLLPEGGITVVSITNIQRLTKVHGDVKCIFHCPYPNPDDPYTEIYFVDGYCHKATGFASGYRGEGPCGLAKACQEYLGREDITVDVIARLRSNGRANFLFTPREGRGKSVMTLPRVLDCEVIIF